MRVSCWPPLMSDPSERLAGHHVADHQPRVQRRNLRGIRTRANLDATVHDRPQRRAAAAPARKELEWVHRDRGADRLEPSDV